VGINGVAGGVRILGKMGGRGASRLKALLTVDIAFVVAEGRETVLV